MPIRPEDLRTGGALQGAVARSLVESREAAALLQPGDQIGAYRVVRELGRGGMAVVYLAERADGEYRQQVALKWIQAVDVGADAEALFRRERQALADLRHPNIARLLDGGRTAEGRPWFAMEYIEGAPIDRHAIDGDMAPEERVRLLLQVCDALSFAHARGVLHRDVKPSNVLVDADGSAKLLDFGIAEVAGQEDEAGRLAFTPGFASPEQLRGEPASVQSDVFQLGRLSVAVLAADQGELQTLIDAGASRATHLASVDAASLALGSGLSPSEPEGLRALLAAADPGQATLPARLPPDLRLVLHRALSIAPQARHESVHAYADDLRAVLEHRPVSARARSPSYVATRWTRRHPVAAIASTLVVLLLASMGWVFSSQLRAERDIAEVERDTARRERDAADLARRRAEAIVQFLNEDVLDAANPLRRAPGAPEVTVREALDAAEATAEQRFAGDPGVLLGVLATLATQRYEFGEYERSDALYRKATALVDALPVTDIQRTTALANHASLMISMQDYASAIAILEPLIEMGHESLGADEARVIEWELRLLEARSRQGADPAFRPDFEALALRADAALGRPNKVSGEAWLFVAHSYRNAGMPAGGTESAQRAYDDLSVAHGPDHPTTLKALAVLGHVLSGAGRGDEAIDAMRRAFETQRARYGPDTLDSTFLQNEYGFMLLSQGRFEDSIPVLADLVERRAAQGGEGSVGLVAPLSNLGNAYLRLGRFDEAEAALDRAIRVFEALQEAPPAMGAILYRGRADVLRETGRYGDAEAALDAGDRYAALLADGDIRALALKGGRARLRAARGDRVGGLGDLDAVIASLRERVPDSHPILQVLVEARDHLAAR